MNREMFIRQGARRAGVAGLRGLLRRERTQGYPTEYLLSRIRGRRSRLIGDWRPLISEASPLDHLASSQYQGFVRERTAEGMWRALLQEHGWVHGQMDDATRRAFAPYFLYAELRTVFIFLRCLEGDKAQKAGEILAASLLTADVKAVLREGDAADALDGLEMLFGAVSRENTDLYQHVLYVGLLPLAGVVAGPGRLCPRYSGHGSGHRRACRFQRTAATETS